MENYVLITRRRNITLQNRNIDYTLRKSRRAKRMRLSVHPDGRVVVHMPLTLSETAVEKFMREKSAWIFSKIVYFKKFKNVLSNPLLRHSRKDYLEHKTKAYILAVERVEYFNAAYGFKFKRISIKNQKSRWGSCSSRGNLNFNYKIALLPAHLADYIVVHELCHLGELNHSQEFWNLVERAIPHYREARRELKRSATAY